MISSRNLKSVDFYRKIPRDLTEASLAGAGLSIVAAFAIVLLFGMELSSYLASSPSTSVVVDKSPDGELLRIDFIMSFPALSCEFASVDVSDALGTNRLNITKTIRKFSIDSHLRPTGSEFRSGATTNPVKHDDDDEENYGEGSLALSGQNFESVSHEHDIVVVNFYAPWCSWCQKLKPSWEKASNIIRERHNPEADGRILIAKVDCTEHVDLCSRHHIQGYPSIRVFRKGTDLKDGHGHQEHESYYGDRDTSSLVKFFETLLASIPLENQHVALEDKSAGKAQNKKRPVPSGGCRIEGFVRVKKVPGNLVVSARSGSHSFDASKMNMSHVITHLSFGKTLSPRMLSGVKRSMPYLGTSHDRLSGQSYITQDVASDANVTIEHYLQVVKTEIRTSNDRILVEEHEYTAHSSLVHSTNIPVAKFHFELSPMQVLVTENPRSFSHFITSVCAIIGGVFTPLAEILKTIFIGSFEKHHSCEINARVRLRKFDYPPPLAGAL